MRLDPEKVPASPRSIRRTHLLLSCIAMLLAIIAIELSDRLPLPRASVAVAQIPDTARQRQDIANESRRTNELLSQILEHLQGRPIKVVMESPDKARGEATRGR